MRIALGVVVTLLALWATFLLTLLAVRPRGMNLREAQRTVPDTVRLLRDLRNDRTLARGVRRWLTALLIYVALPFDLVPDFIPLLGYADDVIIVALVLRRVTRLAGPAALDRHWHGTANGLVAIKRLAGISTTEH